MLARCLTVLMVAAACGDDGGARRDDDGSEPDADDSDGADAGDADTGDAGGDGGPIEGTPIDLADIVGGGDGSGTGLSQGIDMVTGSVAGGHGRSIACPANTFTAAANPLVDGVFCPDGGPAADAVITVSSTGVTITGVPDWTPITFTQNTWDHVWNGPNTEVTSAATGPLIGAHANKGITFDLSAIEAAHGGLQALRFTTTATVGTRAGAPEDLVTFLVYVDGAERFEQAMVQAGDSAFPVSIDLQAGDRFLTLVTAATGDMLNDWSFWAAPVLILD